MASYSDRNRAQNSQKSTYWSKIKSFCNYVLLGQWLYLKWLGDRDSEIAKAQRNRSRAPSWLRDSPQKIKNLLEEYRLEEESAENQQGTQQALATDDFIEALKSGSYVPPRNGSQESDDQHTVMRPLVTSPIEYDPHTSFGLRPAERPAQHLDHSPQQTELYLGPIGEERHTGRQAVITKQRQRPVDIQLILIISCIMAIGLVMVYSSSIVKAGVPRNGLPGDPEYFFRQQTVFMGLGVCIMYVVSRIPYQVWGLASFWTFLIGVIGLVLVFSPLGKTVNGAHRWINIGINIQPIEFVKFSWILLLSLWFGDRQQDMSRVRMFLIPIIPLGLLVILLSMQPDLGSILITIVIFGTAYLISGGIIKRYAPFIIFFLLIAIAGMGMKFDHVTSRLSGFINVWTGTEIKDYNLRQALISFCSGRVTGVGLGNSSQKEYFLPEAHTDFIMTIYGAEFGFIGVLVLVSLYVLFLNRCLYIARRAPDLFGALAATMFALIISMQAFINMAMAVGLLPTKGLTLPLVSYGGSSILITCLSIGVILNISRAAYPTQRGLELIIFMSRFNPLPRLMKWLDKRYGDSSHERSVKRRRSAQRT